MRYQLQYRNYCRKFSRPVRFGTFWMEFRQGILIQLMNSEGRVGVGEIAPVESFGTESLEKAEKLLKSFCGVIDQESLCELSPVEYPCVRFALDCALRHMEEDSCFDGSPGSTTMIPTAKLIQNNAIGSVFTSHDFTENTQVIKLKIGDGACGMLEEMKRVGELIDACGKNRVRIRLDANEQLDFEQSREWLEFLEPHLLTVEFLEQPMDRWLLAELQELAAMSNVPIALDESIPILKNQDNCSWKDSFLYVLKPAIGDLQAIKPLGISRERIILSSVFETAIAFSELLDLPYMQWVPGFDTQRIFKNDSLSYPIEEGGYYRRKANNSYLWNHLV